MKRITGLKWVNPIMLNFAQNGHTNFKNIGTENTARFLMCV